ncbi:spherulin-1A [Penicillium riverlandense]|uniref:spherulin-1A n=1 Tax=Penicillium riverlandense TaxID=1903569 RepID=UPI002547A8CC|nr:spherulin-1A [Penicillium riverlandense]KAJ5808719.1 spherulin-1A [Penicillium riverlandense]
MVERKFTPLNASTKWNRGIAAAIDLTLTQRLMLAPSRHARYELLKDEDFLFDFGNGVGMAIGILGPCGFNTPHVHVGGTEFNIALNGTLVSFLALEPPATNSSATPRVINLTIDTLQATIFPQGSTHMELNPSCETRAFVAAFGTDDFGRTQQFDALFSVPDDVLEDSLGGALSSSQIDKVRSKIPGPIMKSISQCRARCGISPR